MRKNSHIISHHIYIYTCTTCNIFILYIREKGVKYRPIFNYKTIVLKKKWNLSHYDMNQVHCFVMFTSGTSKKKVPHK